MNRLRVEAYPSPPGRSRLPWILAGAVVTALVVFAAAVIYAFNRGDDVTARWETPGTMTSNPWTPSIVKPGAPVTVPGDFVGTTTVASVTGDDCDKEALKKHLASDPKLAQNWAQILAINVNDINPYIDKLQSRRLTVPVQVTNHDYESDRPRELQSVLDSGTAVLADADGTPRVRCVCGNPLKPANAKATKFDNLPPGADLDTVVTDPRANSNKGTAIRLVKRPFVKAASGTQLAPGYTIDGRSSGGSDCSTGHPTPYGSGVGTCVMGDAVMRCWPDGDDAYCLLNVTSTALSRYQGSSWERSSVTRDPDQPDAVELTNGLLCHPYPHGGGQREGAYSRFGCFSGDSSDYRNQASRMWGDVRREGPVWTVRIGETPVNNSTPAPLTAADVRIAYYAIDE